MSNLLKEIEITRSSINHRYNWLHINFEEPTNGWKLGVHVSIYDEDGLVDMSDATIHNEEEAVVEVWDKFIEIYYTHYLTNTSLEHLRYNVIQGFRHLRASDLSGISRESMKITLVPKDKLQPHFSCKMYQNETATARESGENKLSQSEIQRKLAIVDKDGKVMKFFEENKCSVCLGNYKEIVNNDLHIVIPLCGHPLCCECADNILRSQKIECPRCRGNITADSFNLLKFNADLQMVTKDQKVFF